MSGLTDHFTPIPAPDILRLYKEVRQFETSVDEVEGHLDVSRERLRNVQDQLSRCKVDVAAFTRTLVRAKEAVKMATQTQNLSVTVMPPSVENSKERVAFSRPSEDFDFAFPAAEAELIDLAGPCGRFVAAAKRRSKAAQPEEVPQAVKASVKEVPQAVKAEKKTERMSWADMMEEDDGFDWPEAATKSDKASYSTTASNEKWSWSTAATDQDFEDLLEDGPDGDDKPQQSIVIPKSYKELQLEKAEQKLQEERPGEEERLKKEEEIARERLYLEELQKQEQLRQQQIEQLLKQQQLEQLRQQQLQQEQLRQQQLQQEQLRQQQLQQEQLRQQQLQQEQLRQQQEQLRQQQLQQQQLQQQQLQQQQLQLQQNMQMQQLQQMQQMQQLQQVPVLVAVPCMAVPVAAPEVPELKIEEKKKKNDEARTPRGGDERWEDRRNIKNRPKTPYVQVVLARGPVFGTQHRFHQKNTSMGVLSPDARSFTKCSNKGRLSIVCENRVHFSGVVRYAVQFTEGELCSADGVGFILSSDLPCTKNIQKIVSVFANRTGRICVRVHEDVKRCHQRVKCLELGDWLEVISDLEQQKDGSAPTSATISFGDVLEKARGRASVPRSACGYLAVVMKHLGEMTDHFRGCRRGFEPHMLSSSSDAAAAY
eukprot:s89_g37.t1